MSRGSSCGRADLLRAIAQRSELEYWVAEDLGFALEAKPTEPDTLETTVDPHEKETAPRKPSPTRRPLEVHFWRATELRPRETEASPPEPPTASDVEDTPLEALEEAPLASSKHLWARVRSQQEWLRRSRRLDEAKAVDWLSRGREFDRLPMLARRGAGQGLHVVVDRASRLTPYWRDQEIVVESFKSWLPSTMFSWSVLTDGASWPEGRWPDGAFGRRARLENVGMVVALTDLGGLSAEGNALDKFWARLGMTLKSRGVRTLAIAPTRLESLPVSASAVWNSLPWERESGSGLPVSEAETDRSLQRLMFFCSRAMRIEPHLLRALRRLFPEGRRDAGLEGRLWAELDLTRHPNGGGFMGDHVDRLRSSSMGPDPLDRDAMDLVRRAHKDAYQGLRCWEVLNLGRDANRLVPESAIQESRAWLADSLRHLDNPNSPHSRLYRRGAAQLTEACAKVFPKECSTLHNALGNWSDAKPSFDTKHLSNSNPPKKWALVQEGDLLGFDAFSGSRTGSPLGSFETRDPRIRMGFDVFGPSWATDFGKDSVGFWADLEIQGARQKLRWIPPGSFVMGSPDSDPEAFEDEKPAHRVTLTRGYWMFDTPCTQEFWEAVMGSNPSQFQEANLTDSKGRGVTDSSGRQIRVNHVANRPVESVNWNECQEFIEKLNSAKPGLDLRLPTEAEWEYACRAGSKEPTYGELDAVAWYDSNSGNQTHAVGQKSSNPFGLYDTLGNVFEWVADSWIDDYRSAETVDPFVADSSSLRVIRGGSYFCEARGARAAYRYRNVPSSRDQNLGVRCASPSQGPEARGRDSTERSAPTQADAGGRSAGTLESRWVTLSEGRPVEERLPQANEFLLQSDRDALVIQRVQKPKWATEMGRDRYGLWAEFELEGEGSESLIQRLRWIPPGRFQMGSPEEEEGRDSDEGPRHEVILTRGFWLFETPCIQSVWQAVMRGNPSRFKGARRPVESVDYPMANQFCETLSKRVPGLRFFLPSEAQWEYACRAGTEGARYGDLEAVAWHDSNSGGETHEVRTKAPNPWGLYDMLGNVYEWTADASYRKYRNETVIDPTFPGDTSSLRVFRGGSAFYEARSARAAYRDHIVPSLRDRLLGVRCASLETEEYAGGEPSAGAEPDPRSGAEGRRAAKDAGRSNG